LDPATRRLLEAIRAHPDDHELRLVYADAIEESGERERAEFIRRHETRLPRVERVKTPRDPLVVQYGPHAVPAVIAAHAKKWKCDRGLVTHVVLRTPVLAEHGAAMFEAAPITSIELDDHVEDNNYDELWDLADDIADEPWLHHVTAVTIRQYCTMLEEELGGRFLSHLANLETVFLGAPDPLQALADVPTPKLSGVWVCAEGAGGDTSIETLAKQSRPITALQYVGCGISTFGVRVIAEAGWKLERLVFASTHYAQDEIGEAGARILANAPALASLKFADLADVGLDDAALHALATSPHLRLEGLDLSGNEGITDRGLEALANTPLLETLREVCLDDTGTTKAAREALGVKLVDAAIHEWWFGGHWPDS